MTGFDAFSRPLWSTCVTASMQEKESHAAQVGWEVHTSSTLQTSRPQLILHKVSLSSSTPPSSRSHAVIRPEGESTQSVGDAPMVHSLQQSECPSDYLPALVCSSRHVLLSLTREALNNLPLDNLPRNEFQVPRLCESLGHRDPSCRVISHELVEAMTRPGVTAWDQKFISGPPSRSSAHSGPVS